MIERVEIFGWDGIERGGVSEFSPLTVLASSDERCLRAVRTALTLIRIEEAWTEVFELEWNRAGPIGAATFAELVPSGRARIDAVVDGRKVRLDIDVPDPCMLRGIIDGNDEPLFEIGIDETCDRVIGVRGLSNGPRTMARHCLICEIPQQEMARSIVRGLASQPGQQVVLTTSDESTIEELFQDATADELGRSAVLRLTPAQGVLHSAALGGRSDRT